jgi:tripartite-type tricarboxylate transporter receptor subunit TctC
MLIHHATEEDAPSVTSFQEGIMSSLYGTVAMAVFAATALTASRPSVAQDFPRKVIRWIVPYAAGGGTDTTARNVSPLMSAGLGQQIIVDNRPGAAANLGTELVARSAPDGYTWLLANIAFGANPSLFRKLPFDTGRDFAAVSKVASAPMVLVVHPSLPVRTVKELVALAKAKPGTLTYGTGGTGSANHLAAEVFISHTKIGIVHVPYKGGVPAVTDLVGGQISMMFATFATSHMHINSGRLRALAVSSGKRNPVLKNLPTLDELGLTGTDVSEWQLLVVPAGTPAAIIDVIHREVAKAVADPTVKERLANLGATVEGTTPQEAARFLKSELALWSKITREAGIAAMD